MGQGWLKAMARRFWRWEWALATLTVAVLVTALEVQSLLATPPAPVPPYCAKCQAIGHR